MADAEVNRDNLVRHLQALEGERHAAISLGALAAAQDYVAEQFRLAGWSVELDAFSCLGEPAVNVLARSASAPDSLPRLLIGAHLDTVPGTPGADDNASGVAAMLEAARVIAARMPQAPVEFIGFALEELGMLGSAHYVKGLKRRRTAIRGMLSLEMVGFTGPQQTYPPLLKRFYPPVGNFIGLVANGRSKRLLGSVERAMRAVEGLPVETIMVPANGWLLPEARLSDHAPFWDAGYPAVLVTDTAFLRNPHYHQPSDTIETLDLAFLTRVCQGLIETVRILAATPTRSS